MAGRTPFEMNTKLIIGDASLDAGSISATTTGHNEHVLANRVNAHTIENIAGLRTELDSKQVSSTGITVTYDVVVSVDFIGETVTKNRVTVVNGLITNVVGL